MIDDRIRVSVIDGYKKELEIEPNDQCYFIDSVEFHSGPLKIPIQGVRELKDDIEAHFLATSLSEELLFRESKRDKLYATAKAFLSVFWRNKSTIITGGTI